MSSHPDIISSLLESIYVDDIVAGAETEEKTFEFYQLSKKSFQEASFNLRKFCTNSMSLQHKIDRIERQHCPLKSEPLAAMSKVQCLEETYIETILGDSTHVEPKEQKVLGMCWRLSGRVGV